jgi:hypothetical protein
VKRAKFIAAMALAWYAVGAPLPLSAQDGLPLAFMRAGDYRGLSHAQKVDLARDFMRSFCGSLAMPIVPFVRCIDEGTIRHGAGQPIFNELKTCIRTLS